MNIAKKLFLSIAIDALIITLLICIGHRPTSENALFIGISVAVIVCTIPTRKP